MRLQIVPLCAALASTQASAQTIITCGGSEGHSIYFDHPLLKPEDTGWTDDQLTDGSIALVKSGDGVDILIKDGLGMTSALSYGAQVMLLDATDTVATVVVNYTGGAKELYTFDFARRQVVWSQHKFGVMFDKAHTMVAPCQ